MKNWKSYLLIGLCLPLLLTGCKQTPKLESGEEVLAEIDGKNFTAQDLYNELKSTYGTSQLINMVDDYIIEKEMTDDIKAEAKESAQSEYDSYYAYYKDQWNDFLTNYGFKSDAELLETLIKNYQRNLVLEGYLKTTVTDDEINDYYKENIYGEITARHILIKPEVTDEMTDEEKTTAKEAALTKANELISKLNTSTDLENDFINLAKENSADTGTASEGGLIENFTNESGLVDEFWDASLKLEVGKYTTTPVETEYGYHIIYKTKQNEKPALDTVKDKVINKVVEEMLTAENASYVYWAALREKYNMNIYDSTIDDGYKATISTIK